MLHFPQSLHVIPTNHIKHFPNWVLLAGLMLASLTIFTIVSFQMPGSAAVLFVISKMHIITESLAKSYLMEIVECCIEIL